MTAEQEEHALTQKPPKHENATAAAEALLAEFLKSLDDLKAEDVTVINLAGKSDIADYMVIATGRSSRQVSTMAEHLAQIAKTHGAKSSNPEGMSKADWVLLDAGDIIVHLFRPEVRAFYNLEKMWNIDAEDAQTPASR